MTSTPEVSTSRQRRILLNRAKTMTIAGICLIMLLGVGIIMWPRPDHLQVDLLSAQQSVEFPLYSPHPLPKDFIYLRGSLQQGKIIIYTLTYDHSKKLFVSIQSKPSDVNFSDFYARGLSGANDAPSTLGKAVVGATNGQTVGSLVTDRSWVFINAPSGIDTNIMKQIVASLAPVR